jgi:uncharacterized membrane protein YfcA
VTVLLVIIVALAHAVETTTGFGATVIALALGVHFVPLRELVVVLVILGWLQSAWLVARGRRSIQWRLLLARILPCAALGLGIGVMVRAVAATDVLRIVLGAFVVVVAVLELTRLVRGTTARSAPRWLQLGLLTGGGVFHGLFASGGPLVVFALARAQLTKSEFRATLSLLWLSLNSVLLGTAVAFGELSTAITAMALTLLPGLVVGVVVGELLHHRVPEYTFRCAVQVVLVLTGVSLWL